MTKLTQHNRDGQTANTIGAFQRTVGELNMSPDYSKPRNRKERRIALALARKRKKKSK